MNVKETHAFIEQFWDERVEQTLKDYIRIPNVSPAYAPDWEQDGHMLRAARLIKIWVQDQSLQNTSIELLTPKGRTPLLIVDIQGSAPGNILLYGHMDKQPPLSGWREGLSAFNPVIEGDRLYGRGAADDGYAVFAAVGAIKALQAQGVAHPRCLLLIEGSEESGSIDLSTYIQELTDRIKTPDLVVCLDSGCGTYDQLWLTTSLRGCIMGTLRVDILTEGAHSGSASGVVPSSFRIARSLLSRIENEVTGEVTLPALFQILTDDEERSLAQTATLLGEAIGADFAFVDGARCMSDDPRVCIGNRTLKPTLSVTGAEGLPALQDAGNVLRPYTALKLSVRLPPKIDAIMAGQLLKETLEADSPYGAHVQFDMEEPMDGWAAPPVASWLQTALELACEESFGTDLCSMGEGGSIPFMAMLGARYPEVQFVITGVLGPESNAHGPNEFLHIPTFKRVTACIARIVAETAKKG
ncbi:peptidase M20 [Candidatus Uhrbacteria bacterium CG10_big_fil_rev_8_21_14_0_10_50_16]|uniref:Peptidase M20 n=1 Tax=Candidatus Uhrbacteria bacterium CG10_big_fil_rev_8_21_14_0_10_50_16 TaxID=1975039 RepID=A0A2H0RMY5_9BACT|nr:MAG: peptidase M20 [Candidatus Uhrbacteria bacterium CG10_big_fil_rev_8_21_14_0_10_50_16]